MSPHSKSLPSPVDPSALRAPWCWSRRLSLKLRDLGDWALNTVLATPPFSS